MSLPRLVLVGLFLLPLGACCRPDPSADATHAWLAPAASGALDAPLAGTWTGRARRLVPYGEPDSVPLELRFDGHGGVTGRLGNAHLAAGRVLDNRGAMLRDAGWPGDWLVEAELAGELSADGGPHRTSVTIPFDVIEGALTGGLYAGSASTDSHEALTYALEDVVRAPG